MVLSLTTMTCTICTSILGIYAKAHPTRPCPLAKALRCSICAKYGHTNLRCERRHMIENIPNIHDEPSLNICNPIQDNMITITDSDAPVRAALLVNNITPMTCQEKGKKIQRDFIENKKRLIHFYKIIGLTLVLVKPKQIYLDM